MINLSEGKADHKVVNTVEERAERARLSTITYYYNNIEQERERSRVYQTNK